MVHAINWVDLKKNVVDTGLAKKLIRFFPLRLYRKSWTNFGQPVLSEGIYVGMVSSYMNFLFCVYKQVLLMYASTRNVT